MGTNSVKSISAKSGHPDASDVIIVLLAVTINVIVLVNSILHHPLMGYDVVGHLNYIATLPERLPDRSDSGEYFSPPLPYFLPSIAYQACSHSAMGINCKVFGGNAAQLINVFLSIGITILFLKIADLLQPGNKYFKISLLTVFSLLTVYYKTFSQVRGEPYLAFLTILIVYLMIRIIKKSENPSAKNVMFLGISFGLLILSRQWGFLLLPAFFAFAIPVYFWSKPLFPQYIKLITLSLALGFLVGGWFYIHLQRTYGTVMAFNKETKDFSFANQPASFYRTTGLKHLMLFRSPTRKTFDNLLLPIFYSDTWGDYWGYFVFVRDKSLFAACANKPEITSYLGRVNAASLAPSLLMAGGMLLGIAQSAFSLNRKKTSFENLISSLLTLMIVSSLAGYMWFLISHPMDAKGTTIKATYMIQVFMIIPLLTATFMERIRLARPNLYLLIMTIYAFVFFHNLPAMITRYWRSCF